MERRGVALMGACGRMGSAVTQALSRSADLTLVFRADRSLSAAPGPPRSAPDLSSLAREEASGIIDFSSVAGMIEAAAAARRTGCALVSGTTGVDDMARHALRDASRDVPVCWSPNFSVGVAVLLRALADAAKGLPAGWQLEIAETHHAGKRDAPSGTALRLAEAWRRERGGRFVCGREGNVGPRDPEEVGIHALRIGDVVGEHRVLFGGEGEILEYVHRVQDRAAFAAGCVEALRRLLRQGPGFYEWSELLCG